MYIQSKHYIGDRVDKRGALTGGFHDSQRSRLQFAFSVIATKKELNQVQNKSTKAKTRIQELDKEITQILGDLQKKQVEKKKYDSTREPLFIDLSVSQKELNQYNDSIEQTVSILLILFYHILLINI
jgi:structural maintenance of chromosome 3 (chondroitin sulfate proteoglycan 6)